MRKYLFAAALGLGTVASGAAAASLAGAQTNPTPATTAPAQPATRAQAQPAKPDPATRIKEALAPLVTDGTLAQAQADKAADTLKTAIFYRGGKGGGGGKDAAAVIGIDEQTLRTELNGKTLAQVAEAHGKTRQQLIDGLMKAETTRIDQAVTDRKLTREQADQRKAGLAERVTRQADEVPTPVQGRGPRGGSQPATPAAPANP